MAHFSSFWLFVSGRVILIAVFYGPGLLSEVAEFQIFDTAPSDALNCRKTESNKWPCKHERWDGSLVSYTRIRQHGKHVIKYHKVTRIFMAETMVRNLNLFVFDLYSFCIPKTRIPISMFALVRIFCMLFCMTSSIHISLCFFVSHKSVLKPMHMEFGAFPGIQNYVCFQNSRIQTKYKRHTKINDFDILAYVR